jgi:hypothetical protein
MPEQKLSNMACVRGILTNWVYFNVTVLRKVSHDCETLCSAWQISDMTKLFLSCEADTSSTGQDMLKSPGKKKQDILPGHFDTRGREQNFASKPQEPNNQCRCVISKVTDNSSTPSPKPTNPIINSTEQSPSWKANRSSANHEIPRILWNP